jgi:hypothetical protein
MDFEDAVSPVAVLVHGAYSTAEER